MMNWKWIAVVLVGSSFLFLSVFFDESRYGEAQGMSPRGFESGEAPKFSLDLLKGGVLESTSFRGKVVLVNFWATWCGPCVKEVPMFTRLYTRYYDEGFEIIGVSVDEDINDVRDFSTAFGVNYPIGMSSSGLEKQFGGVMAVPTTFVIDRNYRLVDRFMGYQSEAFLVEIIERLLKEDVE